MTTDTPNADGFVDYTLGRKGVKERTTVASACWQCVSRDAIVAFKEGDRLVKLEGNPKLKRGGGKICSKGQAGVGQLYDPDRMLAPLMRSKTKAWLDGGSRPVSTPRGDLTGDDPWVAITWEEAEKYLRDQIQTLVTAGTPEKFAYHYGRQKAAASKINKTYLLGYIGTATVGNHTSICEGGKWTAQELVWGKHYDVPDLDSLVAGDFVLNLGCNIYETHTNHIARSQRVSAARGRGVVMWTSDPRLSNTAARSDKWLPVKPGTDLALALGVAHRLVNNHESACDKAYLDDWCDTGQFADPATWTPGAGVSTGFDRIKDWLNGNNVKGSAYTSAWAAGITGISVADINEIASRLASSTHPIVMGYRGAVTHYNGVNAERATMMLNALLGNIGKVGGMTWGTGAKWSNSYAAPSSPSAKMSLFDGGSDPYLTDTTKSEDGGYLLTTHHASHQLFNTMVGKDEYPDIYLFAYYNPIYANGDCKTNIEVLEDRSKIPFVVAADVAYSEGAHLADMIIPDVTYLERWEWEDMVSENLLKEFYLRQPVVAPLEGNRDFKDFFRDVVNGITGPSMPAGGVPFANAEAFVKDAIATTTDLAGLSPNPEAYMLEHGAYYDPQGSPSRATGRKEITEPTLGGTIVFTPDDPTKENILSGTVSEPGIYWDAAKAPTTATRYQDYKSAYKGYKGRRTLDGATVVDGWKPDKTNNSGLFDIFSRAIEHKALDGHAWAKDWAWPDWHAIPGHEDVNASQGKLHLITYKHRNQTHSRTQNCKLLSEMFLENYALINPVTAASLNIADGDVVNVANPNMRSAVDPSATTATIAITAKLSAGIHPDVVAISHHCGHWQYGRFATAGLVDEAPGKRDGSEGGPDKPLVASDPDVDRIWYADATAPGGGAGVHPNWIIPNWGDPIAGQQRWNDAVVNVSKA